MKQHKWHKEIKAWADGAEIEARNKEGYNNPNAEFAHWWTIKDPRWETHNDIEYRIKLQPKEPKYINVYGYLENQNICFQQQIGMPYIGKMKLESNDD